MTLPAIDIDPDIARARTLPSALYHAPAWWERQRTRVFPRAWHLWPGPSLPEEVGEMRPWRLLDGCLSEPLLVVRGADAQLRCLSNVCTHRGNLLVREPCRSAGIRCHYHGRRFGLDGRMISMPEFEGAEDFPSASDDLPRLDDHTWNGMLFASLAPRNALAPVLAHVDARTNFLPVAEAIADPDAVRVYEFDANWALYCDNYLEGFHIPYVHPGLRGALDYPAYETEVFPGGVLQVGIADGDEPVFTPPPGHVDHGRKVAAYYYWLFPCTMLNFYPWGISVNVVLPQGPTRTRVVFVSRVWNPELRERGAGAGLDRVEMEDEEVIVAVQQGVRSRSYDRGRYSPSRERGVHHFHRMLAQWLAEDDDEIASAWD